ncbi:MAG: DUF2007 domain-containing protein [Gammaproteobacteria bacterium]|nr:DUF2007 domain-containing protein [Gammaproteobacteria bacterium]MDH5651916.1 DUF2007 domain-containing protein [Gammaproteobacteria bacterium]
MQKLLYVPNNALSAHLLQGILQQEGIPCQISGEYLQGGVGELPPIGIVRLTVDEADLPRAEAVIRGWEAGEYALDDSDSENS